MNKKLLLVIIGTFSSPLYPGNLYDQLSWGEQELICRTMWNDSEKVKKLLAYGVDPDCRRHVDSVVYRDLPEIYGPYDHFGEACGRGIVALSMRNTFNLPLAIAAAHGDVDTARALLEARANPHVMNGQFKAPLELAIEACQARAIPLLLEYGVSVNALMHNPPRSPLWYAVRLGCVSVARVLLAHGADVNHSCSQGTPLQEAISSEHIDMVRLLLEWRADIDSSRVNQADLHALLRDEPSGSIMRDDLPALHKHLIRLRDSAEYGREDTFKSAMQKLLWLAVGQKKWAAIRLLLKHKMDLITGYEQSVVNDITDYATEAWRCALMPQEKDDIATSLWALQQGDIRRTYRCIMSCSQYPERYTIGVLPVELLEHIIQAAYPWITSEHMHTLKSTHDVQQFVSPTSSCCCVQ